MIPKWFKAGHKELVLERMFSLRHPDSIYIDEVVRTALKEIGAEPNRFHYTLTVYYEEDK